MFLNKIRNIFCVPDRKFVSATNVVSAGKRGNLCVGNNVSATMCPRLPGPLRILNLIARLSSGSYVINTVTTVCYKQRYNSPLQHCYSSLLQTTLHCYNTDTKPLQQSVTTPSKHRYKSRLQHFYNTVNTPLEHSVTTPLQKSVTTLLQHRQNTVTTVP